MCRFDLRVFAALLLFVATATLAQPDRPRGLYALGSVDSLSGISEQPFITGFSYRTLWSTLEPAPGVYDFSGIAEAVAATQARGQGLNIEVLGSTPPAHVIAASTSRYLGHQPQPGPGPGAEIELPTPWDTANLTAWQALLEQMAIFEVALPDGTMVPLKEHPSLVMVSGSIPGLGGLRDLSGNLTQVSDYDRETFIAAVVAAEHASRDPFAEKFGFIAFFAMDDGKDPVIALDEALRERLMTEFNNPGQPTLGFFQENLSDVGPNPDGLGRHLKAVSDRTYIVFQALTAWTAPFTGADKVTSGNPAVGIELGFGQYGATYFELYSADIENPVLASDLTTWAGRLAASPSTSGQFADPGSVSGAWFDPASDGDGFVLVAGDFGLFLYFFGYDLQGDRLWLVSNVHTGAITPGTDINLEVFEAPERAGGGFQSGPLPPSAMPRWGTAMLRFDGCEDAALTLSGVDGTRTWRLVLLARAGTGACTVVP